MAMRENWWFVGKTAWNIEQFTYFEIYDRGADWKQRYALIGYILEKEFPIGAYVSYEEAEEELDAIMGLLD